MSDPKDSLLSSYDYELESELIAQLPLEPRHSSRLLIVDESKEFLAASRHAQVWDLQDELRPDDLLVINDTRVLKARLKVRRHGGGMTELLLLEPNEEGKWLCLARPAKKIQPGDYLWLEAPEQESIRLKVISNDVETGGRVVQFPFPHWDMKAVEELLNRFGEVPLPPYIQNHNLNENR